MRFLSLPREIKDMNRFREIITIIVKEGFHDLLSKARLSRHAKLGVKRKAPETTPERVRETLEALGPTFVKLGQVLSLRSDLVPHEYCEEFRKLQDEVPALTYPIVKGVVESELRQPINKVFKTFDHEPIAAASVAQVHKAVLKKGEVVAVKVQRPGIGNVMERDVDIMEFLAKRLDRHARGINAKAIVNEFKDYTRRELDFKFELRNIKRFHEYFKDSDEVIIPAAHDDLCTSRLLVMDYLKGVSVSDKQALKKAKYDFKRLANIGFRAIFEQVFQLGSFHADPHPGNLLAMRRGGKQCLGFLDFGIVGFVDEELQTRFLQILDYLIKRDVRGITWCLLKVGTRSSRLNLKAFQEKVGTIVTEWHGSTFKEEPMSILVYRILQASLAQGLEMPANIILIAKAFVTIEGAGFWLEPDFNPLDALKPALAHLRHLQLGKTKESVLRTARDLHDFLGQLPLAADALLDKIEEGKVEVAIDQDEFRRWEHQQDFETSRKTLAVTCGAFFVGSSIIAGLASDLGFLGVPLWQLGFALFLLTLALFIHVSIKMHKYMESQP